MASLTSRDYRGVLGVLREAGDASGPNPFPEPVLSRLRELVPCDVVAYHERLQPRAHRPVAYTGEPRGLVTPEIRAACRRHQHEDPLVPAEGARKYSDFLTRRQYHRLALYQECDRPVGIEFMMRLWIDPRASGGARLEFDRADSDFDERDRAVLDLLLPHLRQFQRAAVARRTTQDSGIDRDGRLTTREREILAHVADGKTNGEIAWALHISPETVRKHLENIYEKLGVHTRTAAVAAAR